MPPLRKIHRTPSMRTAVLAIVPMLLACGTVPAQDVLVIRNGTLIDGTGAAPVADAVVVVEKGTIRAAGPASAFDTPEGARELDAGGGFIIPGLIDAHVHYSQTGWFDGRPDALDLREDHPYYKVIAELKAHPERFFDAYLCAGVTATFDVGGYPWTRDLQDRFRVHGAEHRTLEGSAAPHVAAAGALLTTIDFWLNLPDQKQFVYMADEETVREAVRSHASLGSDAIKVWFITPPEPPDSSRAARLVHVAGEEADRAGLPFIVHATGLWEAKEAVRAGADVLVHSVFEDPVDDEFLGLARANDVIYIPTLTVQEGYLNAFQSKPPAELPFPVDCVDEATAAKFERGIPAVRRPDWTRNLGDTPPPSLEQGIQNLGRVHAAGITVATGTDAGNPGTLHGPSIYREMELMERAGLSPLDVLVASTRNAARAMGRGADLGTLEVGKTADIVVLQENPLENVADFRSVRTVIRGGKVAWRAP